MPEGDTVLRTARRLHEALAGRPLLAADLRWPGISTADLSGMTVTEVTARGKHILLRLDSGWTLHSHLRMDGQWRIEHTHPRAAGAPATTGPLTGTPAGTVPPATGPAATVPPATGPAATGPIATAPPATGPAANVPPATVPPATGPAATGPIATGSIDTGPPATGPVAPVLPEGAAQDPTRHPPPPATEPAEPPPRQGPSRRRMRAAPASAPGRPDARAVLVGPEWTAFGLRLGMLDLVRTGDEHTLIGHLGPDILDDDFDTALAVANLAASDQTIGAALLDQRNLAGIGTLWSSESLFLERLNPWVPAAGLPPGTLAGLVERARRLMRANLPYAVQSSTGDRRDGHTSYVHARSGRQCRRCGTIVRVHSIGPPTRERPMFYCPGCQGGLAPGDEGPPPAPLGARRRMP